MNVLISVDPLTDLIGDFLKEELEKHAFTDIPYAIVEEAIRNFNSEGMDDTRDWFVETFTKRGLWTINTVHRVDDIVDLFSNMFDLCKKPGCKASVEYDRVGNQAIVQEVLLPAPPDANIKNLKEDYHHALERNDFFSERLRRAFDEISR